MNPSGQYTLLQQVFESILSDFVGAAIIDESGRALAIKSSDLVDLGSFPTAAEVSDKYMQLKHNEVVLLNDPHSGGSHLSSMTLVMGYEKLASRSGNKKLLFCARIPFRPVLGEGDTLDQEGIRIPPAPVFSDGNINTELMSALLQHPLCPEHFKSYIEKGLEKLLKASKSLESQSSMLGFSFSDKLVNDYLDQSHKRCLKALDDFSLGETKLEQSLDAGKTKLALHLTSEEKLIRFDFTGTTASQTLHLTDNATFGACAGALFSALGLVVPKNHGSLQTINVVTPKNSMVNSTANKSMYLGMTDGTSLVASLALKAIGQIDPRKRLAQSGISQCSIELIFEDGKRYFDHNQMGLAAGPEQPGVDALDPWKRSHLNPSIAQVESRFPLKVLSHSLRQKSGGSGFNQGGDGVTRKLETTQSSTMIWRIFDEWKKNEGIEGGKTGSGPEVAVTFSDGKSQSLGASGKIELPAGSVITIHSAGGGGVGEIPKETEDF